MSPDEGTTGSAVPSTGSTAIDGVVVAGGATALPNDPQAIEELIAQRRASLAATIDELMVRTRPKEIARRTVVDARARLQAFATTPEGVLRTERLVAVAGAAATLVATMLLLRRRRGRAR